MFLAGPKTSSSKKKKKKSESSVQSVGDNNIRKKFRVIREFRERQKKSSHELQPLTPDILPLSPQIPHFTPKFPHTPIMHKKLLFRQKPEKKSPKLPPPYAQKSHFVHKNNPFLPRFSAEL
jgi:hypothetical protein